MNLKDLKQQSLSPSFQILVFAVLIAALIAVSYFFYLQELLQQREALQSEVAQLEISVAQGTAIAGQLERFKQELARLEERLNVLRGILPNEKETPQVLRSVQLMAAESNLKVTKFYPQPVAPHPFYSDWPILLEAQGSYDALGWFFERVSQSTRIINVDSITIRGIEGSMNPNLTLNASCTATTFVFREDLAAAAEQ